MKEEKTRKNERQKERKKEKLRESIKGHQNYNLINFLLVCRSVDWSGFGGETNSSLSRHLSPFDMSDRSVKMLFILISSFSNIFSI